MAQGKLFPAAVHARCGRCGNRTDLRPGACAGAVIGADFCVAYPEITLEVVAEDRTVDLVEEQCDVAIRINPSPDSSLVGRCFAKDRLVAVAAPSIAMPSGEAVHPVPGVVMSSIQPTTWVLDGGRLVLEPVPRMQFSSFLMVRDAVIAGGGVALIPQSIASEQLARGALVQWAPSPAWSRRYGYCIPPGAWQHRRCAPSWISSVPAIRTCRWC
ncbi:hypothetical protein C9397_00370 [Xanthomonas vasicola pv. vasculorum]|uniref:LysR substrate-binding domain-containing protein n=1 Tax=Xanthomonas vasicola pv. vasculorum TaxID=325776 RepID=A0AAE8F8U7_XANVA|nr:LysR substrate-binding domain-containing protein [Xanthomonas vasicola]AVQ05323.1 hypothetical protein C7V42_00200 [Xanthomonas vasicola pv. vasculorum]AZM69518.1 hypothetical protein CXP37_00200 [Xanthomonas vasicola pv. vasculorum]PDM34062.1 hypothetical protein CQW50_12635 [Xanthomonas vasicola pv. vasculorum]PUE69914.1 hypothetical protein C7Y63_10135 [Xanthomonas vasicola pv. vasculorum]PUE73951.1 hypothetical protein C7Y61_10080 [Xanthomonas vasicola pv. vasculorum]